MKPFARFSPLVALSVLCLFLLGTSAAFGQKQPSKGLTALKPGYVRMPNVNINSVRTPSSSIRLVLPKGATSTRGLMVFDANGSGNGSGPRNNAANNSGGDNAGPAIPGLDTVPTFAGAFSSPFPSIDPFQSDGFTTVSPWVMIGNQPQLGGTTVLPADLVEVSLQLLNPDGTVFANVPFGPFAWAARSSETPCSALNSSTQWGRTGTRSCSQTSPIA